MKLNYKILSGSAIKMIAVFCMVVDHTSKIVLDNCASLYEPLFHWGRTDVSWQFIMQCGVGRLAFPLFAFLVVEGYSHTRSVRRYARTLCLFALLSIVPWSLMHGSYLCLDSQNVLFTLLLGVLAIHAVERFSPPNAVMAVGVALLTAWLTRCDYGATGVAFIVLLHLLRQRRLYQGLAVVVAFFTRKTKMCATLAIVPMAMYNGRRGFIKGPVGKYLLYAFYPLHILLLVLLRNCVF